MPGALVWGDGREQEVLGDRREREPGMEKEEGVFLSDMATVTRAEGQGGVGAVTPFQPHVQSQSFFIVPHMVLS